MGDKEIFDKGVFMEHHIEHEQKLVDMLGYSLLGPDSSNRWLIFDENDSHVGYIQYKKLKNKNVEKNYPATYGYVMVIDSSTVKCNLARAINPISSQISSTLFSYRLNIKRTNGTMDCLDISIGESPKLILSSKEYGDVIFDIDHEKLYLNFKSETDHARVEEILSYQSDGEVISNQNKEYFYQIRYCDKNSVLTDGNLDGTVIREISGRSSYFQQHFGKLSLCRRNWVNGKVTLDRKTEVSGTIEEMVEKHKKGIDSFLNFRAFINQILPFKQEVISAMMGSYLENREEFSMFIPELGSTKEELRRKLTNDAN